MGKHKHAEVIKAWADGAAVEVQCILGKWWDSPSPQWDTRLEYRIKPEPPAKVYPSNALAHSIMCTAYLDKCKELGYTSCSVESVALNEVANAALRHAIDSGTLVPNADYVRVICALGKAVKSLTLAGYTDNGGELWKPPLGKSPDDRAARDLAIAEAVMTAFLHSRFTITGNDGIDLPAIIATVKE